MSSKPAQSHSIPQQSYVAGSPDALFRRRSEVTPPTAWVTSSSPMTSNTRDTEGSQTFLFSQISLPNVTLSHRELPLGSAELARGIRGPEGDLGSSLSPFGRVTHFLRVNVSWKGSQGPSGQSLQLSQMRKSSPQRGSDLREVTLRMKQRSVCCPQCHICLSERRESSDHSNSLTSSPSCLEFFSGSLLLHHCEVQLR